MKNAYRLSLLFVLSLFLFSSQPTYAALVPVEKTSSQAEKLEKRIQRKKIRQSKRQAKQQFKKSRKRARKKAPNQTTYYGLAYLLFIAMALLLVSLILIIVGFSIVMPILWILGFIILGVVAITVTIALVLA